MITDHSRGASARVRLMHRAHHITLRRNSRVPRASVPISANIGDTLRDVLQSLLPSAGKAKAKKLLLELVSGCAYGFLPLWRLGGLNGATAAVI